MDSLLIGVMLATLYWMKPEVWRSLAAKKRWLAGAVVVLVAWLAFATPHVALDESIGYTLQAIGYCALIVLVLEHSGGLRGSWMYRGLAWLGVYSYGIYLWHSLALAPGDYLIHKASALGVPSLVAWPLTLGAQFVIAIALGYLTTRAVEFPFLRLRDALFPDLRGAVVPERRETPAVEGKIEGIA
ncbi:MAG TPA: acyltransferase, partial [Paraburkholderia sp.]|uniref:acyltransferase family protein n=1 Tax=Paraburkholderia sp. TaxID=1926495 RepID=UPI002D0F7A15|nr:acyltransferase [Paraburkholderia sp.]